MFAVNLWKTGRTNGWVGHHSGTRMYWTENQLQRGHLTCGCYHFTSPFFRWEIKAANYFILHIVLHYL